MFLFKIFFVFGIIIILINIINIITRKEKEFFSIKGNVIRGDGEAGRDYGFPTANVSVEKNIKCGMYEGKSPYGETIIMSDGKSNYVECNIMDFNKDIYGELLQIKNVKPLKHKKLIKKVQSLTLEDMNKEHKRCEFVKWWYETE